MPTPSIVNPFTVLASIGCQKEEALVTSEDTQAASINFEAVKNDDPPLLQSFLKRYPRRGYLSRHELDLGEKLLRCLWRGDLSQKVMRGHYRHFKGSLYVVSDIGTLLEGPKEESAVIYFGVDTPDQVFLRPVREWKELVIWPDGEYRCRFMPEKVSTLPPPEV